MQIIIRNSAKAEIFSSLFQHIKLFTEHINIMFEHDKVYIQSMDSGRISIFEITIPATWFDLYELESASAIPIGVSTTLLFRILNTRDKNQEMLFKFDTNNDDTLFIEFTSNNKSVFNKSFELPLINLEYETMEIPDMASQADISICSASFANMINQMKLFGDTLEIKCNEENIMLYALSQESGKMQVQINNEDLTAYSINEGETVNLSFGLTQLHNICMYSKLSKEIDIFLKDNFPMKIVYNLGDPAANLIFYLAPKIGDD